MKYAVLQISYRLGFNTVATQKAWDFYFSIADNQPLYKRGTFDTMEEAKAHKSFVASCSKPNRNSRSYWEGWRTGYTVAKVIEREDKFGHKVYFPDLSKRALKKMYAETTQFHPDTDVEKVRANFVKNAKEIYGVEVTA